MNTESMNRRIVGELARLESREDLRVLYACESGSRAWGFASTDSDYDVRFVYVRDAAWYLSVEERRDVIEQPIDDGLDLSGWDLRKALRLMRKSNPALIEWLQSPIVYAEDYRFYVWFRRLADEHFNPRAAFYHYYHHAASTWVKYLARDQVRLKKYLYALRPLLACRWLEQRRGWVPMEFATLLDEVLEDDVLRREIDVLLERKRAGIETGETDRIRPLDVFIQGELERLSSVEVRKAEPASTAELNDLFRTYACVEA